MTELSVSLTRGYKKEGYTEPRSTTQRGLLPATPASTTAEARFYQCRYNAMIYVG